MNISYFNGKLLPKDEIKIDPDDRGFLFADGIYEVVRWYEGYFYDMNNHMQRLRRSLREIRINWSDVGTFPSIAKELVFQNELSSQPAMVYLQVTRGVASRSHNFPLPEILPTIYAYAWSFVPYSRLKETGIKVMLKDDIRWGRCDIKSVALLPNTLGFQEAYENGMRECIFVRNGYITEGSHSNIFFVIDDNLITHPEANQILTGITRINVLRIAKEAGLKIREEPLKESSLGFISEAFITNTSSEITPVIEISGNKVGDGVPGPVTRKITELFDADKESFRSQ